MSWRVFSQKGLQTGISSSPQHEGLSILGSQQTDPEELKKDFGCCCNVCREKFTDLFMEFHASHSCIRAEFVVLVKDYSYSDNLHWIYCGRINLNTTPGTSCNFGRDAQPHATSNYDDLVVPESLLAIANQGKKASDCCTMTFALAPAPFPSRKFLSNDYTCLWSSLSTGGIANRPECDEIWEEGGDCYDDDGNPVCQYSLYVRAIGNVEVAPRICEDVHNNVTNVRISTPKTEGANCKFHGFFDMSRVNEAKIGEIGEDGCCVLYASAWAVATLVHADLCATCKPPGWYCAIPEDCGCCTDTNEIINGSEFCDGQFNHQATCE